MSNLTRWDPFREMVAWRNAMDRMFENALTTPAMTWQPMSWDLALDVSETGDEFLVKASLPGIDPQDVDVTFENNVLTIQGEIKEEKNVEEQRYHLRERRYGSFRRSVTLPASVKAEAIEASYEQGVLTLHLPKAEEVRPKRILVQTGTTPHVIESATTDIKHKN
jgi:HSP20 family protein